jgi:hypothetical protein
LAGDRLPPDVATGAGTKRVGFLEVRTWTGKVTVIVAPRATAVPIKTAESEPTQRDGHLQLIAEQGRMAWQKASGYTKRARAETAISRWKRVIGDRLRSHTDEGRATEANVAVHVLNRILELGRPAYVCIA